MNFPVLSSIESLPSSWRRRSAAAVNCLLIDYGPSETILQKNEALSGVTLFSIFRRIGNISARTRPSWKPFFAGSPW